MTLKTMKPLATAAAIMMATAVVAAPAQARGTDDHRVAARLGRLPERDRLCQVQERRDEARVRGPGRARSLAGRQAPHGVRARDEGRHDDGRRPWQGPPQPLDRAWPGGAAGLDGQPRERPHGGRRAGRDREVLGSRRRPERAQARRRPPMRRPAVRNGDMRAVARRPVGHGVRHRPRHFRDGRRVADEHADRHDQRDDQERVFHGGLSPRHARTVRRHR